MLGPQLGLDFRASALIIVFFTLVCAIPPAWLTTCGPGTGMRQMVQARYGMGYFPTMVIGLANCFTLLGFMSLTTILGGQCLSLSSGGNMSWDVGIAVVCVIGLCVSDIQRVCAYDELSFIGLRALHILSLMSFPVVGILYFVLIGVVGNKLHFALNETAKAASAVTVSNVLGYCASQIGYTASFSGVSSDFVSSTHLEPCLTLDNPASPAHAAVGPVRVRLCGHGCTHHLHPALRRRLPIGLVQHPIVEGWQRGRRSESALRHDRAGWPCQVHHGALLPQCGRQCGVDDLLMRTEWPGCLPLPAPGAPLLPRYRGHRHCPPRGHARQRSLLRGALKLPLSPGVLDCDLPRTCSHRAHRVPLASQSYDIPRRHLE